MTRAAVPLSAAPTGVSTGFSPNEPGSPPSRRAPAPARGVFLPTGTIVSGASMLTNLVHAAVQPSGDSGHRSSGRDLGPPMGQTP